MTPLRTLIALVLLASLSTACGGGMLTYEIGATDSSELHDWYQEVEPNDRKPDATHYEVGARVNGEVSDAEDQDYFYFGGWSGRPTVVVEVTRGFDDGEGPLNVIFGYYGSHELKSLRPGETVRFEQPRALDGEEIKIRVESRTPSRLRDFFAALFGQKREPGTGGYGIVTWTE